MVVTFIVGSLEYTCNVLDLKRLNKQKVEANQILKASLGLTVGWSNHPAVLMWKGYANALKYYFNEITRACIRRGFNNKMTLYEFSEEQLNNIEYQSIQDYLDNGIPSDNEIPSDNGILDQSNDKIIFPWWFNWQPLIYSHRASLLRKSPEYYEKIFKDNQCEYSDYLSTGYVWPHKLTSQQILNFIPAYCDEIGTGAPAIYRWSEDDILEWLNDIYVNPRTGRKINPTKKGIYADLKKAAKLYGLEVDEFL
jgi:hypothetical protein